MRIFFEHKNKRLLKKKGLVSEDIYWEKKKTTSNMRLWWVRTNFWDGKKFLGNHEWGHSLKIKTKGYKRKKVWRVRISMERKKEYNKQKVVVSEDTLLRWKKSLEIVSEDILWREKQKTIKEKGSGEWGHLLRKKKTTTNKR